jgi:hypothetical protein
VFESSTIDAGSSGGGLFDEWGELVAMVDAVSPPRAKAIPINVITGQLRSWHQPDDLRQAALPRRGYRYSAEISWLSPQGPPSSRFPSGRVTVTAPIASVLAWHVGALRLAPTNLSLNAGVAGVDIVLRSPRFAVRAFAEGGAAETSVRTDAGGYYLSTAGAARYVPFWQRRSQSSVGVGFGGGIDVTVLPHLLLTGSIAHWTFPIPAGAAHLPGVVFGAGIRIGITD